MARALLSLRQWTRGRVELHSRSDDEGDDELQRTTQQGE
jgi:hypothetical protein